MFPRLNNNGSIIHITTRVRCLGSPPWLRRFDTEMPLDTCACNIMMHHRTAADLTYD